MKESCGLDSFGVIILNKSSWTTADNKPWFTSPVPYTKPSTATVIGAGLAGSSIAYHLAQKGWKVTVLEQHAQAAQETSSMPAGIIKPRTDANNPPLNHYYQQSYTYFIAYLTYLLKTNPEINHSFCGIAKYINQSISQDTHFKRHSGWLSPRDYCLAQLNAFENIKLCCNSTVSSTIQVDKLWHCLDTDGNTLASSEICILASGWALSRLPELECLNLKPLSGQVSSINSDAVSTEIKHVIAKQHYLIPYSQQSLIIGASHHPSSTAVVNKQDHLHNLQGMNKLIPDNPVTLDNVQYGKVGIHSTSNDHQAIIGSVPDQAFFRQAYEDLYHGRTRQTFPPAQYIEGLYVIAALGSHGLSTSAYLGKMLSEIIQGSADQDSTQQSPLLHPARFLMRALKRNKI